MFVFSCLVASFCIVGYVANQDVSHGFSGSETSVTKSLLTFIDDMNALLMAVVAFLGSLRELILAQISQIKNVTYAVSPRLKLGTKNIVDQMQYISDTYNNDTKIESDGFVFPCEFCATVGERMTKMRNQVQNQTASEFEKFDKTIDDTNSTFVEAEETIRSSLGGIEDNLEKARLNIKGQSDTVTDNIDTVEDYDNLRRLAINALFAIPLASLVVSVIGALLRKGCVFTINWLIGFLTMYIIWILFTVHAPISAITADVCVLLDSVEEDNFQFGDFKGNSSKFFVGCMNNTPLSETFNVSGQMDFRDAINFPTVELDVEALFNFSEMNSFGEDTATLDSSTFGGPVDANLETIRQINGTLYTRENLNSTYNPWIPSEIQLKNATVRMIVAEQNSILAFEAVVAGIKNETDLLMNISTDTKKMFNNTLKDMNKLEELMFPIFDKVDSLAEVTGCGFLRTLYYSLKDSICVTMLGGVGTIVFALFLIGFFMIPLICLSIMLAKRMSNKESDYEKQFDK